MDTILQDLIGALDDATDCKGIGYVLKNIRQHLLETDSTSWDYVVDEVISRINEIPYEEDTSLYSVERAVIKSNNCHIPEITMLSFAQKMIVLETRKENLKTNIVDC